MNTINKLFSVLIFYYILILIGLISSYNEYNYYGVTVKVITCLIYLFLLVKRNKYTWFLLLVFIGINFLSYYFIDDRLTKSHLIFILFVQVFPFDYFNTIGLWGYKNLATFIYCLVLIFLLIFLLTKKGRNFYNFRLKNR